MRFISSLKGPSKFLTGETILVSIMRKLISQNCIRKALYDKKFDLSEEHIRQLLYTLVIDKFYV